MPLCSRLFERTVADFFFDDSFSRPVSGAERQGRGHGFLVYPFVDAAYGGHVYAKQVCWMVRDIPCDFTYT